MKFLYENGYHIITFATLIHYLDGADELPAKPVIITFDDGWEDQFGYALPGLEKYHYSATFFVVTNFVGSPGFLSWSQLRRLLAEGMEIGSHSRSHPHLDKIKNPGILWDQIYTANRSSRGNLGRLWTSLPTHTVLTMPPLLPVSVGGAQECPCVLRWPGSIGCVCAQSGNGSQ